MEEAVNIARVTRPSRIPSGTSQRSNLSIELNIVIALKLKISIFFMVKGKLHLGTVHE